MKKLTTALLLMTMIQTSLYAQRTVDESCTILVSTILQKEKKSIQDLWGEEAYNDFLNYLNDRGLNQEEKDIVINELAQIHTKIDSLRVKNYIEFSLSYLGSKRLKSLNGIKEIQNSETENKFAKKFLATEKKLEEKKFKTLSEKNRYSELYYSCRALSPNAQNRKAADQFKKFSLTMGLGTLASSYAVYNMDKEKDLKWFMNLGYDIGFTVFYSVVGAKIQTRPNDTQLTKTIRNYFFGRALGATDVLVYGPLFINERERAENRLTDLKKLEDDQKFKEEVQKLKAFYEERSVVRKFQEKLVYEAKRAIDFSGKNLDLGVVYSFSKDQSEINWNSISKEDLDNPLVQEMLMLAAMNEAYNLKNGEYIQTGEIGTDRYLFSSLYSLATLPKNFFQSFWTFNILCMNQDRPAAAFTKALLLNVSINFMTNQVFYAAREKTINQ